MSPGPSCPGAGGRGEVRRPQEIIGLKTHRPVGALSLGSSTRLNRRMAQVGHEPSSRGPSVDQHRFSDCENLGLFGGFRARCELSRPPSQRATWPTTSPAFGKSHAPFRSFPNSGPDTAHHDHVYGYITCVPSVPAGPSVCSSSANSSGCCSRPACRTAVLSL